MFPSNAAGTELLAVTESVKGTYRMDTATLDTKHQEKYTDSVTGDLHTAHPKMLPSGEMVNIVIGFSKLNKTYPRTQTSLVSMLARLLCCLMLVLVNSRPQLCFGAATAASELVHYCQVCVALMLQVWAIY